MYVMEINLVAKMALLNPRTEWKLFGYSQLAIFLDFIILLHSYICTKTKRKHESDLLPTYVPSMCK